MSQAAAPTPRLSAADVAAVNALAAPADAELAAAYPGARPGRQPVHTVYIPADQITPDVVPQWGSAARSALDAHAGSAAVLAEITGRPRSAVEEAWPLILAKLAREPIEDLRIDLEDGYGARADDQEDHDVVAAVRALTQAARRGSAPPYWGIRFKCFEAATRGRGLRTLDLAIGAAGEGSPLPDGFVVTLPKVTSVEQVRAMVEACRRLEHAHHLQPGRLRFEIQIETPQAILGADGSATVARMVHASDRRCTGLHFGTYDYTAALGVSAGYQAMDHPAAEHAKQVMAVAAAGTGVRLSDGSTNVLPVGERSAVHAAWHLHASLVRRSLEHGYYQGWDLHPAQLPTRYLSTYVFFRDGLASAGERLRRYLAGGGGDVLDEPATARALAGFLRRGVQCGAVQPGAAEELTGVELAALDELADR